MRDIGYAIRRELVDGPLRFDRYMSLVLYDLPQSYYRNNVPGETGDYRTSPNLTSHFGRLVAVQAESLWRSLGSPPHYDVVEVGAGDGSLAKAFLDSVAGDFASAIHFLLVEPFDNIRALQQQRLANFPNVRWVGRIEDLEPSEGLVIANEVLDNFPVRAFEVAEDKALEVWIEEAAGGGLKETLLPPSMPLSPSVPRAIGVLEEGDRFEVSDHMAEWARRVSSFLVRGHCLVIDYGAEEPEIWNHRPAGTLVTYRQGQLGVDPLAFPGEADITSHVNFTHLATALADHGTKEVFLKTQREWLLDLGLRNLIEELRIQQVQAATEQDHAETVTLLAERGRVDSLIARGGLGDLLVYLGGKGV